MLIPIPRTVSNTVQLKGSGNPRFGLQAPGGSAVINGMDSFLGFVSKTRTREMLLEDIVGFGVLRGVMDLFREYFYNLPPEQKPQINIPAARERAIREIGSVFTDNILGGVLAFGMASLMNKMSRVPNLSNQFIHPDTLSLWRDCFSHPAMPVGELPFLDKMAQSIAGPTHAAEKPKILAELQQAMAAYKRNPKASFSDYGTHIAKILKKTDLDHTVHVVLPGKTLKTRVALDELVEDTVHFTRFLQTHAPAGQWKSFAQKVLKQTRKVNIWRLPIALSIAMACTFAVPYLNRWITQKIDHISSYPGEIGLKQQRRNSVLKNQPWYQRFFPYLTSAWQAGNILPIITTLIPLSVPLGLINTYKIADGRGFFNNPFRKGFIRSAYRMLEFGKHFPFTTQQQMAACFALLISSRLSASRDGNEFRERLVDSGGGWAMWIVGTPLIKRFVAKRLDKNNLSITVKYPGATLLKPDGTWKRAIEIKNLLPPLLPAAEKSKLISRHIKIQFGSLLATILTLGIIEPYIGIKWTEWNTRQENG